MKRLDHIDFLRAIAIIVVIITHILSYRLGTTLTNTIWNYLHFVVPILVYCSGYVMYKKYNDVIWKKEQLFSWYKKRAIRLLLPYFIWTAVHYGLWYFFPSYLSGLGLDYGWLPLLFIELMVMTPLYISIWKRRNTRWVLSLFIGLTPIALLFIKLPFDYRYYMWIPWSAIVLLSFTSAQYDKLKTSVYIRVSLLAFALFALGNILLPLFHAPLTLTLHKYPPDIFYLSYGIGIGSLLTLVHWENKVVRWLSTHAYDLFFAHYILIDSVVTSMRHLGK